MHGAWLFSDSRVSVCVRRKIERHIAKAAILRIELHSKTEFATHLDHYGIALKHLSTNLLQADSFRIGDDRFHQSSSQPMPFQIGSEQDSVLARYMRRFTVNANDTERFVGYLIEGNERHSMCIIEVGQPREKHM